MCFIYFLTEKTDVNGKFTGRKCVAELRGCDVLVATPGRLSDMFEWQSSEPSVLHRDSQPDAMPSFGEFGPKFDCPELILTSFTTPDTMQRLRRQYLSLGCVQFFILDEAHRVLRTLLEDGSHEMLGLPTIL